MSDRSERTPDDGWRDIHLDDILKGVSTFIALVSDVVETVTVNQSRRDPSRPLAQATPSAPTRLGAGALAAGVRDPIVELFDEGAQIVVVIEWPYVDEAPIEIDLQDDVLSVSIGGEPAYTTEILLPGMVNAATLERSYRNGMTEVRLQRANNSLT
jgi:HSP20 family molecular chaperone IbpA